MELEFSRDDLIRTRAAIQSCMMAIRASETGQKPGSKPYNELAELLQIESRFIALIEAGQPETVYNVKLKTGTAGKPDTVKASLPGLGGPSNVVDGPGRRGKTEGLQQKPGETSKGNRQTVPTKSETEKGTS